MTKDQIALVQATFEQAVPLADELSIRFYRRLFEIAPATRAMFPEDMAEQRKKLVTMLAFLVRGLQQPELLVQPMKNLGARHVAYRVESDHYDAVGQALLHTLSDMFGDLFTAEAREAWAAAYALISATMREGSMAEAA